MLLLLLPACGLFATKPPVEDDGRPCYIGALDSETVMLLRASHPKWELRNGDLIITPFCAGAWADDLLHEGRRLTTPRYVR
jgi:hypothetical protein